MIAATVYDTDGEEATGLVIGNQLFCWDGNDPAVHSIAAVLHEDVSTVTLGYYRRLAGWLATRPAHMWAHLHAILDALADDLAPVGPTGAPATSRGATGSGERPVRAGWFCD